MIILKNNSQDTLIVNDLGIHLNTSQEVSLSEMFLSEQILNSNDLEDVLSIEGFSLTIDGQESTYRDLVDYYTRLTRGEHKRMNTMSHSPAGTMFFETAKNDSGQTEYITYYNNHDKEEKIREEHILRDEEGRVSSIVISLFEEGTLVERMTQVMHRKPSGAIDSIDFIEE